MKYTYEIMITNDLQFQATIKNPVKYLHGVSWLFLFKNDALFEFDQAVLDQAVLLMYHSLDDKCTVLSGSQR